MKINGYNELDELHALIDRYFDGDTSLEEEKRMRRLLADSRYDSPQIEAARAVSGVFATARRERPQRRSRSNRRPVLFAVSVAASIAIIIGAVLSLSNLSVNGLQQEPAFAAASHAGSIAGRHDSIAQVMKSDAGTSHSVAVVSGGVNRPDSPDEVAALISSEMGYMAEAQRSVYESVDDNLMTLSSIMQ